MKQEWMNRAALYELLAHAFLGTSHELVRAIISGEYSEAVVELGTANELDAVGVALCADELAVYQGRNADELFHELRIEHTRLFVGAPRPAVSPYAGIWWAHRADVKPLLFVNTESMAVERFYRSCGVGQPANSNEPLDHIGSELEFLQYLCLVKAEVVSPPEEVDFPEDAYGQFYRTHFAWFAKCMAETLAEQSTLAFYRSLARLLALHCAKFAQC